MKNINNLIDLAKNYLDKNNFDQAKKLLAIALNDEPLNQQANILVALICEVEGNFEASKEYLKRACSNTNLTRDFLYRAGTMYMRMSHYHEAKNSFTKSLEISGEFFEGLHDLGVVYANLGENEEALICFEKAKKIKYDSPNLYFNLGKLYEDLLEFEKALENYEICLKLDREFLPGIYSKAEIYRALNKLDEAINCYDEIFRLRPNEIDALCGVSTLYLLKGDYKKGWEAYSHRWKQLPVESYRFKNIKELDSISSVDGKKILVWYEQGLGDSIQFSRYIPLLLKKGANVTLQIQEPLEALFRSNFSCEIICNPPTTDKFDFQIPLLGLPKIFNTDLSSTPQSSRYLKADPHKIEYWKDLIPLSSKKYNIAIAISGNANHINDHNRSIPLSYFKNLIEVANLFVLQKELKGSDLEFLGLNKNISFLGNRIQNFDDSAAIIELMDLVISVDTSLIHLAGAQEKKAFLMLPYVPEWRWLTNRSDSPWYKSIQIFRQQKRGEWQSVIDQIYEELKQ